MKSIGRNPYQNPAGRRKTSKRLWLCVGAVAFVGFVLCVSFAIHSLLSSYFVRKEETASERGFADISGEMTSPVEFTSSEKPPEILEYFEKLIPINSDIVGLVGFGDGYTRYVCQGEDNLYYLTHKFDRSDSVAGMIFMDCTNSIWPRSDNLILYGHNMADGSRFGTLKRYVSQAYLQKYPEFRFASLYEVDTYEMIAIFYATVDSRQEDYFDFMVTDFRDEIDFQQYMDEIKRRSIYDPSATAEYGDRLLTLVTCTDEVDDGRLVIVCRKK